MPKLDIDGQPLWYSLYGTGKHAVLLIPGAIGTGQSDFFIQLDPSDPNCFDFDRFTFVAVELPGWGRSAPPARNYGPKVLEFDADCCVKLMQHLGYDKYSVVGWSEGAKVSLVLARKYGSDKVRCVVLQGIITYASETGTKHILWSRNMANWDQKMLGKYIKAYGDDEKKVTKLWDNHMNYTEKIEQFWPDGILGPLESGLAKVEPPMLVLHGDKDFFVELEHSEHVTRHVPNCEMVRFEKGAHNLHQTEPKRYKEIVEGFLTEN